MFTLIGSLAPYVVSAGPQSLNNLQTGSTYTGIQPIASKIKGVSTIGETVVATTTEPLLMQVTDTCNYNFEGEACVNIRSGPGTSYPLADLYMQYQGIKPQRVRSGQAFLVDELVRASDGSFWYRLHIPTSTLMFPGRFHSDWYISANYLVPVDLSHTYARYDQTKYIVVSLSQQELYAYNAPGQLYMKTPVSTGRDDEHLSTPTGDFRIYKKVPLAMMEGPLPGTDPSLLERSSTVANFEYTLFVPYAMAFDYYDDSTAFIHDAYWHWDFGQEHSHGCVNAEPAVALQLYKWVPDPSIREIPVAIVN